VLPPGTRVQGVGPRFQDTMPHTTRAVDGATDVEALAIRPQGRMASDAPAEPREGGGTHPHRFLTCYHDLPPWETPPTALHDAQRLQMESDL
jgi:hypothetical protein